MHLLIVTMCVTIFCMSIYFFKIAKISFKTNEILVGTIALLAAVTYIIDGKMLDAYYDIVVIGLATALLSSSFIKILRYKSDMKELNKNIKELMPRE